MIIFNIKTSFRKFFICALLLISAASAYPQSNVLKFMGIPVAGTVAQMSQKLKAKGFKPTKRTGVLVGTFKGKKVELCIISQSNKVVGLVSATKESMDDGQAFIYYTNVCKQYMDSDSYDYLISNSSGDKTFSVFTQKSRNSDYNLDPYDSLNRIVTVMLQRSDNKVLIMYANSKDAQSLR